MRFTPGELRVMKLLWQQGPLTPPELQERFPEPIKDPALRSYLKILVDKGHVRRERIGKAFRYEAVTPQRRAFGSMMRQLAETFGDGSLHSLMLTMAKEEKLTEDDLAELREAAGLDLQHESKAASRNAKKSARKRSQR